MDLTNEIKEVKAKLAALEAKYEAKKKEEEAGFGLYNIVPGAVFQIGEVKVVLIQDPMNNWYLGNRCNLFMLYTATFNGAFLEGQQKMFDYLKSDNYKYVGMAENDLRLKTKS